jgi:hypothetical protein
MLTPSRKVERALRAALLQGMDRRQMLLLAGQCVKRDVSLKLSETPS